MILETVVEARQMYPYSAQRLWEEMGDPRKLSVVVPMLRAFQVKGEFCAGTRLEEVHTIGGWPQRYVGEVLHHRENVSWAMSSVPVHALPWGLPHTVAYSLYPANAGTELRIRCVSRRLGLLRLFVPEWVVRFTMQNTLNRILAHVARCLDKR